LTIITAKKDGVHVAKVLAAMLLCWGVLHANPTFYLGAGSIGGSESFTVKNPGVKAEQTQALISGVQFKAGYGERRAYAVEFDLGYARYDKNIFSDEDTDYYYFDLSLIKAFDFGVGFYPFFKLGYGTGELEIRRTLTNSISSGSFFGGIGTFVPLFESIDLEISALYRVKSWEDLDLMGAYVETSSHLFEPYIGLNFRF